MATGVQVVFDCADPVALARFWAAALGYEVQYDEDWLREHGVPEAQWNDASAAFDPERRGPRLYFQRVPEPKVVKNRVHLDINAGGPHGTPLEERRRRVDAEVERLAGLGATRVRAAEQFGEYWVCMLDPEGNEFDVQ